MSQETSPNNTLSTEQSKSRSRTTSTSSEAEILDKVLKAKKKRNEAEQLQLDSQKLNIDSNLLHSGHRYLRSHKTLLGPEEKESIERALEKDRLLDQEISLRPRRAGQTTEDKHLPARRDFEHIYRHIDELACQVWASDLEPWLEFVLHHDLISTNPSIPILDKDGTEYPDVNFSLETLLKLPTNKKYLKRVPPKKSNAKHTESFQSTSTTQTVPVDGNSSSSTSGSFVVIPNKEDSALDSEASPGTG